MDINDRKKINITSCQLKFMEIIVKILLMIERFLKKIIKIERSWETGDNKQC